MKAIVTVIGEDKKGIIARVSSSLLEENINIEDISQTIMQDYFVMLMLIEGKDFSITKISKKLEAVGSEVGVDIRVQHEELFNKMHKV